MELEYFGANAIKIKSGSVSIGFDLSLPGSDKFVGASKELKAVFYTDSPKFNGVIPDEVKKFEMAGEYEIGAFSVRGATTPAKGEVYGTTKSNVFLVDCNDFGLVGVIGYASPELSPAAAELLANARIIIVPVGGMGLSLEPEEALKVVKSLNAEFVIPVHFDDGKTKYESPQASVEEFTKLTGSEADEFESKVNTKGLSAGTDGFKVIVVKP
jgi:L-ascorbate metabolism protein UlaG (beta-lactamase superfamily)